jgi:hypothetical protein
MHTYKIHKNTSKNADGCALDRELFITSLKHILYICGYYSNLFALVPVLQQDLLTFKTISLQFLVADHQIVIAVTYEHLKKQFRKHTWKLQSKFFNKTAHVRITNQSVTNKYRFPSSQEKNSTRQTAECSTINSVRLESILIK